ncbi:hypothetical protein ACFMJM_22105, partial [Acinetobacter baumannii]
MNIVQDKNMLPDDQWIDVCALDDLTPNTTALVFEPQYSIMV